MAVMRLSRRLRTEPNGVPFMVRGAAIDLPEGTFVDVLETSTNGWTRLRVDLDGVIEGWVSSDGIAEAESFSLSKATFASQCVSSASAFGSNAYYLMTAALQRTNVKSFGFGRDDGLIGPFALTTAEWDAIRNVPDAKIDFHQSHITVWTAQVMAFAMASNAMQIRIAESLGRQPGVTELFFAQSFGSEALIAALEQPATPFNQLIQSLDASTAIGEGVDLQAHPHRRFPSSEDTSAEGMLTSVNSALQSPFAEAVDHVRPAADEFAKLLAEVGGGIPQNTVTLNFASPYLDTERKQLNAEKITSSFARAGYGAIAQLAAVANAIGESRLNHEASNTNGEDSHGLFQLNRNGGVGTGHSVAELKDADSNIAIMINHIWEPHNKAAREKFMTTKSIAEAVQIFVYKFEKPADKAGATAERIGFAKSVKLSG